MNTIFITNERIAELAKQAQENIAIKANDDYDTRWWKPELYDQEFVRLIIQEVVNQKVMKLFEYTPLKGV